VPTPETGDSRVWNPAVFVQDDIRLAEQWHLLAGVRGDGFYASARDPLPPPGVTTVAHDTASADELSGNASLLYRATHGSSYYVTWQSTTSLHGNLGGGGISLQSDGKIDPNDLRNRSDLLEAGAKYSLVDNRLFAGAALFTQRRSRTGLGDVHQDIRVQGLELESVYQPSPGFSATFNATVQEGEYLNAAPFQLGGRDLYAAYLRRARPGRARHGRRELQPVGPTRCPSATGRSSASRTSCSTAACATAGPMVSAPALDGQWQSRQRGNLDDQWHLPAQYTLNASLSWTRGPWTVNVDLLNLTDQRNWIHNGDAYTASILILPDLPLRAEGYVKYRF
jgi:outer membrane receptor protein involved in Fe transport